MKKTFSWLGLLTVLSMPLAQGANQEIRALFQPDPSKPWKNTFINKTPNSGYCATYPDQCEANNMFSIQVPIRFSSAGSLPQYTSIRVKAPANWRRLTVTNQQTQESHAVEVRIIGLGSRYRLSQPVTELTGESDVREGHRKLWLNDSWVYAPAPCQYSGVGAYNPLGYQFFWKTPQEEECIKYSAFRIPDIQFDSLDIAYELRTPDPLAMSAGLYTGSLTYSVGHGADFSMGTSLVVDDHNVTLDFVLDVQHTLKVDLPPGGNRIALEPEGGWQPWLNTRRIPERLYRDQTFHISASSRFKMFLQCGRGTISDCYLFNDADTVAARLFISVTLPNGLTDESGKPVRRRLLRPIADGYAVFQPGMYVDRQQGTLHFDVEKASIKTMLTMDRGNKYSNTVVVVFDSEI
ncbi:phage baseplate upper protein [Pseudomonas sp. BW7P1]|uniref:phage baseplate upper protein n=1 Tax=Pseudomonas TaxID=286 RepID=UPI0021AD50DF|nr:phage baseplate upper protein [Pseudomonas sp. BW7P1]UWI60898.1 phage baseplate upper protein [Pseudomonas sp. BW7P1]